MKMYAWIVGAWTAVLWFFTFGVARLLFEVFPRARAGEVTTALFPTYFAVTIVLGVLANVLLWPKFRRSWRHRCACALQLLALLALIAIPVYIQPSMGTHAPGTAEFARWHGISMALNLFSLLAVPAASLLVLARRKE